MKTYTLFWSHLPQLFLEWEMFHTDLYIKSKDSLCLLFFFFKCCRLWDNAERHGTAGQVANDSVTRRVHIACWINKAANTWADYVIIITLPRQHRLRERAALLRYIYIASLDFYRKEKCCEQNV